MPGPPPGALSLFEEQIEHSAAELDFYLQYGTERFASRSRTSQPRRVPPAAGAVLEHIARETGGRHPRDRLAQRHLHRRLIEYGAQMQQAGPTRSNHSLHPHDPQVYCERVENVYLDVLRR